MPSTSFNAAGGPRIGATRPELGSMLVGLVATLMLHLGLAGLFAVRGLWQQEAPPEKETEKMEFEDVKLLELGEEKPDNQLPRIANPPPPEQNRETVEPKEQQKPEPEPEPEPQPEPEPEPQPEPDPDPEPEPEPEAEPTPTRRKPPKPDESEKREQAMNEAFESLHNPRRPTNDDVPEGSSKGVVGGSLSDEALANLMGTFQAKLIEAISKRWQVPTTIPEEKLPELKGKVEVYVRLSANGHVVSYRFRRRSDNEQFNSSIERVLKQFQVVGGGAKLPLPDNERVRKVVLRQGLNLQNWEYTGR